MTYAAHSPSLSCCAQEVPTGTWDFIKNLSEPLVQWHRRGRDVRHLSGLSDQHLKDIGIHRSEITSVVYGGSADISRRLRR
jgi:uncharacterized protein YjiS (DUF1127 family)